MSIFCGFFYQVYKHHLFNYFQIYWPDSITCGKAWDCLAGRTQQKTLSPHVHHLILIVPPSAIQTYFHYSFPSNNTNIYSTSFLYASWIICIQYVHYSSSSVWFRNLSFAYHHDFCDKLVLNAWMFQKMIAVTVKVFLISTTIAVDYIFAIKDPPLRKTS